MLGERNRKGVDESKLEQKREIFAFLQRVIGNSWLPAQQSPSELCTVAFALYRLGMVF